MLARDTLPRARSALREHTIDCLVLYLPAGDAEAIEALEAVLSSASEVPVVVVADFARSGDRPARDPRGSPGLSDRRGNRPGCARPLDPLRDRAQAGGRPPRPPGATRFAHRPAEPRPAARSPQRRGRALAPATDLAGAAVPRSRRVQARQRQPRPRRRGLPSGRGGAAPSADPAAGRHRGPLRRGRVRDPVRGPARGARGAARRRTRASRDHRAVPRARPRAGGQGERRGRPRPAGPDLCTGPDPRSRSGDVPSQAAREWRGAVRHRDDRGGHERARNRAPAAERYRARRAAPPLPADPHARRRPPSRPRSRR